MRAGASILLLLVSCASTRHQLTPAPAASAQHPEPPNPKPSESAAPYTVLEGHGGREVSLADFKKKLESATAVCIGESHDSAEHHQAQLLVTKALLEVSPSSTQIALGLEMVEEEFQGVLDDFAKGTIDRAKMLSRVDWENRWGYDFEFYAPMVALTITRGGPLLALNAPAELAKKIARRGIVGLSATEKKALPELDLKDEAHRSYFKNAIGEMEGHGNEESEELPPGHPPINPHLPPGHPPIPPAEAPHSFENVYAAQVLRDETMAERAARWLSEDRGHRRIVILAGTGHCEDGGVPARIRRRKVGEVLSIRPVLDDGEGTLGDALAAQETDLLVVLSAPRSATTARP